MIGKLKNLIDRRTIITAFGMILVNNLAVHSDSTVKTMAMNILLGMTAALVTGNVVEAVKNKKESDNAG